MVSKSSSRSRRLIASVPDWTIGVTRRSKRLIAHLDRGFDEINRGDLATLETQWQEAIGLVGRHVLVETPHATRRGLLLDITWEGIVLAEADQVVQIQPETVRHLASCEKGDE